MDTTEYRTAAEQFLVSLEREYYLHFAGHKDELEIEPVYDRHADLFTRDAVQRRRQELEDAAPGTDEHRRARILADFAVDGYMGAQTKTLEAEQARLEAVIELDLDGTHLGFREASVVQANEPDAGRRAEIEQASLKATAEQLNPIAIAIHEHHHAAARALGWDSYKAMCEQLKGLDLDGLHRQTTAFLQASAASYRSIVSPELERGLGLTLQDMRRSDFGRMRRTPDLDRDFASARLLDSLFETATGLGIDIRSQDNVHLDVESRPNKSPRAFCAPVRSPDEVYLVIAPTGGRNDFRALFHEAGHTEHFAHMDADMPFEFRHLGDNAITESFAFLFEHLTQNQRWLTRRLGVREPEAIVARSRAELLVMASRYAAKLGYELELHGGDRGRPGLGAAATGPAPLAQRYAELLGAAVQFPWPAETYVTDVDPGFYCSYYLRAWALEIHLRRILVERFGEDWYEQPGAAELLREWWSDGQRLSAEEFLGELTGEKLDFGVLTEELVLA
jgi:hypothetical protein